MAKDFNGIEIKVGDVVTRRFEAVPRDKSPAVFAAMMREKDPDYLYFDGFGGSAKVSAVMVTTVEVEHPGLRGRIPVFASSLLEVVR
ncbi:hypothetical protein [Rosistilla oblonga]|uniref:hypothetical protein n=1 Tax=Rosistilla oblonga TaxID=2527990 RepID=UPI003A96D40C